MTNLIVLDRDGVINEERRDFVKSPSEWRPIPGSLEAIGRLSAAGWDVVVVTNQSGLARGLFSLDALSEIHAELRRAVELHGGRIAGIFFCPHGPDDGCACRKPAPGLLRQVEAELGRPVAGAPLIGDRLTDVELARRAGCSPILVRTGHGADIDPVSPALSGVPIHSDLADAADALLARGR